MSIHTNPSAYAPAYTAMARSASLLPTPSLPPHRLFSPQHVNSHQFHFSNLDPRQFHASDVLVTNGAANRGCLHVPLQRLRVRLLKMATDSNSTEPKARRATKQAASASARLRVLDKGRKILTSEDPLLSEQLLLTLALPSPLFLFRHRWQDLFLLLHPLITGPTPTLPLYPTIYNAYGHTISRLQVR